MQRRIKLVSGQADNSLIDTPPPPLTPLVYCVLYCESLSSMSIENLRMRGEKKSDILLHVLYVV